MPTFENNLIVDFSFAEKALELATQTPDSKLTLVVLEMANVLKNLCEQNLNLNRQLFKIQNTATVYIYLSNLF